MLYKLWFFRINFLMSVLLKELQNCIICIIREWSSKSVFQKQPSRGVLKKRCSENMQQIYIRTPMPNCDFNKVAKPL